MDSMRSLNSSLPKTKQPSPLPQPDVTQSFRAAALTVTNLYKSAIAEIDKSHADGYQEAVRDILGFLDRENLGIRDGEGWKIRQWAIERLDGAVPTQNNSSDSDDEASEEKEEKEGKEAKRPRSTSPTMDRNSSPEETRSHEPPHADSTHRSDSAPPPVRMEIGPTEMAMEPPQTVFQFSSAHPWPSNNIVNESAGPDMSSRRTIASPRRTSRPARNLHRTAASNILGNSAGQKRKLMQEYFNIDSVHEGGTSKRGRMS